jgi:phosphoglycerate dehydrogenase-like enzyme
MDPSRPPLVIGFELSEKRKAIVADALAGASAVVYLTELDGAARAEALRNTGVLLTFNTAKELRPGEAKLLNGAQLIQFMIGGVDFIPLSELPEGVPVAVNGGGYAESMAEHALAMTLAAAKRLVLEHENLKRGQFNQFTRNRMLAGRVCGIFGFGGIGAATARLMHGTDEVREEHTCPSGYQLELKFVGGSNPPSFQTGRFSGAAINFTKAEAASGAALSMVAAAP